MNRTEIDAPPFTARLCETCGTWVYVADGPFAEGDRTKTLADADHFEREHASPADYVLRPGGAQVFGFPYMPWNEEPVRAVRET